MAHETTVEVRARRAYRVDVERLAKAPLTPADQGLNEVRVPAGDEEAFGRVVLRLLDGGAQVLEQVRAGATGPGDFWNIFRERRTETRVNPDEAELRLLALAYERHNEYLEPEDRPEYLYSRRRLYSRAMPFGNTAEVSGYNLSLTMTRPVLGVGHERRRTFGIQTGAAWVHGMRTASERLADYAARRPFLGEAGLSDYDATRREIEVLQYEKFDAPTERRAQKDMAIALPLAPGLWLPAFTGGDLYHGWDVTDTDEYHCTAGETLEDPPATPWLACGEGCTTTAVVTLVPRRVEITFRWAAIYDVAILFNAPFQIARPTPGAYADRLPMSFTYQSSAAPLVNDAAMSEWIRDSNRYALALRQDLGFQVFSAYLAIVLTSRQDGLWSAYEGRMKRGDLAAILDVFRGKTGERTRYRVLRKTDRLGTRRLISWGSLQTDSVQGMAPTGPIWNVSPSYGPV